MIIQKNIFKSLLIITFLLISSFLSLTNIAAAEEANSKIAFVQLRIEADDISLISFNLADGKLKSKRSNTISKEVYYEVISKNQEVLSTGNIDNPLVKRLEYENPNKSGEILNKTIKLESAEFTIRIDYDNSIDKVNFYKTQYNQELKSIRNADNLIGSVSLTSITGGEND